MNNIVYIKAEGSYSRIVMVEGSHKSFIVAFNMKTVSEFLDYPFMKVHRSFIVNTEHIVRYYGAILVMDNKDEVLIGDLFKDEICGLLNIVRGSTKEKGTPTKENSL